MHEQMCRPPTHTHTHARCIFSNPRRHYQGPPTAFLTRGGVQLAGENDNPGAAGKALCSTNLYAHALSHTQARTHAHTRAPVQQQSNQNVRWWHSGRRSHLKCAETRSKVASDPPAAAEPRSPHARRDPRVSKTSWPRPPDRQRLFTKSHGGSMEASVQRMSRRAATRTGPGVIRSAWRVLACVIDRVTRADTRIGA